MLLQLDLKCTVIFLQHLTLLSILCNVISHSKGDPPTVNIAEKEQII